MNQQNRRQRRVPVQNQVNHVVQPNQNPPQQPQVVVREPFHGHQPLEFNEKYCFGPQAEVILREKFSHLERNKKFHMSCVEKHDHPYGAFARKFFNRAIHSGLTRRKLIDVGGHLVRTATSQRWTGVAYEPAVASIHSMLPMIEGLDELRHKSWRRTLAARGIDYDMTALNACNHGASHEGLCPCSLNILPNPDVCSIDSAYYPGVLEGIEEYLCLHNERYGYLAFHDYKRAYVKGIKTYQTPDDEALVEFRENSSSKIMVSSSVVGNPKPYEHEIVETGDGKSWSHYIEKYDVTIVYEVIDRLPFNHHDYILVVATPIAGTVKGFTPITELRMTQLREPIRTGKRVLQWSGSQLRRLLKKFDSATEFAKYVADKAINLPSDIYEASLNGSMAMAKSIYRYLRNQIVCRRDLKLTGFESLMKWITEEGIDSDVDLTWSEVEQMFKVKIYIGVATEDGEIVYQQFVYRVDPDLFQDAYPQFIGKPEAITLTQVLRSENMKKSEDFQDKRVITDTVCFARLMANREYTRAVLMSTNIETTKALATVKNPFSYLRPKRSFFEKNEYVLGLIPLSITLILLAYFIHNAMQIGVEACSKRVTRSGFTVIQWACLAIALIVKCLVKQIRSKICFIIDATIEETVNWFDNNRPRFHRIAFEATKWLAGMRLIMQIPKARADKGDLLCESLTLFAEIGCVWAVYFTALSVRGVFKTVHPQRNTAEHFIKSTCVTIPTRLDLAVNKGRIDPKWRFNDPCWNITGMKGAVAKEFLGCKFENKIMAAQIGPALHGSVKRTPTVKHSCKQCVLAAAIRATSNKISPDPNILKDFRLFMLEEAERARKWIAEEGGIEFNVDEWAQTYPEKYREEIYRTLNSVDLLVKRTDMYDSFPKVELQFTTVPHDMKDSECNDVKERQISAPNMNKKIFAGVVIKRLEKLFGDHSKTYCGSKNWPQLCDAVTQWTRDLDSPLFCMADGSGFDMTQVKALQKIFTEFMEVILSSKNITWDLNLTKEKAVKMIRDSEMLMVNVDRGSVQYKTEGRASGDSWTTFANTVMNMLYWRFALASVGFNPEGNGIKRGYKNFSLLCKGDDTLFAVDKKHQALAQHAVDMFFPKKNELREYGLGLVVKVCKWGQLEEMEFLSNRFFKRSDGSYRMVRIPARVLQSSPWSTKVTETTRDAERLKAELVWSKGSCMMAWAKGLPIFHKLAQRYMELGRKPGYDMRDKEWEYVDKYRVWNEEDVNDKEAFLEWLHSQFGISDVEVAELEGIIEEMEQYDHISIPTIEKFY